MTASTSLGGVTSSNRKFAEGHAVIPHEKGRSSAGMILQQDIPVTVIYYHLSLKQLNDQGLIIGHVVAIVLSCYLYLHVRQ